MSSDWIGVDLDGTLAEYHGWVGPGEIGEPVPAMLARVKQWLAEGKDVRIFTARCAISGSTPDERYQRTLEVIVARSAIRDWCARHLGRVLPITNEKDLSMVELWDDRCVQVEMNTGRRADGRE